MSNISKQKIKAFQRIVWGYYREHKRDLPWRMRRPNPYKILVSEIMLQQTQAPRVVGKYQEFIKRFPTVSALAQAPASEVIRAWQGLGYNRRALYLHRTAQSIMREHQGRVPRDPQVLEQFPGIGPYTARAIAAFAYNDSYPFIETNIRTVFIHHFFPLREHVRDAELLPLIEAAADISSPREWYTALMDYGSFLKAAHPNPSRKSAHYTTQKPFKGSEREVRGALVRVLASHPMTRTRLESTLSFHPARISRNLEALKKEGLVIQRRHVYTLAS